MASSSGIGSSVSRTPASPRLFFAAPNRVPTVLSKSRSNRPCGMPSRSPASDAGCSGAGCLARHHGIRARAVGDSAGDRPDRVERVGERERALGRHAPLARLVADDAAECARNAGRAAGVGADRDLAHLVRGGDGRARRRAARNARAIRRIARRAVMRVHADAREGELAHVGLGDDHGAGGAQSPHHWCVGFRRSRVGEDARAGARRLARDVEQVLDADDRAVEGPERDAGLGARVSGVSRRARGVRIDREAGARPLAVRIGDARERLFETVAGRGHVITGRSTMS